MIPQLTKMMYLRKPAFWVLPTAFAIYLVVMFPIFQGTVFAFDSFYNVWRARKIVEDPSSLLRPEFMGRFGPLYTLVLFLIDRSFGFNPMVYALINGSLHLLNVFLLFRIVRHLIPSSQIPAILTSLVFLFSSTQWGAYLDTSLTTRLINASLFLSSLLFFLKFLEGRKKRSWSLSFFFFIISFGFIEDALVLPLLLLAILFLVPPRRIPWKEKWLSVSPFFLVSLMYGVQRISVGAPQGWGLKLGPHMLVNLLFLIREFTQFLLIPRREFVSFSGWLGPLLRFVPASLILFFAGTLWYCKRDQILGLFLKSSIWRVLIFGMAWPMITASLYSLRQMQGVWQGRYLYFPGMGAALVVGVILYVIGKSLSRIRMDPKVPDGIQGVLRGSFAGIILYGLILNVSTTFLMVGKARAQIQTANLEEIPAAFSIVSAVRDYFKNPFEFPPHTILVVEGLPFSTLRLRQLLQNYFTPPSMIIEAREGRPLKDLPTGENQRILYLKWEGQNLLVAPYPVDQENPT